MGYTPCLPAPLYFGARSNASTNKGTDDGLGGGNRKAKSRSKDKPGCAAELGAGHGQDQGSWLGNEMLEVNDAVPDSASHTRSEGDSADEFGDHGQDTGLRHAESARGHRCGIGVGDIVGAISEGADAEGDRDQGDDPGILFEHGHCWVRLDAEDESEKNGGLCRCGGRNVPRTGGEVAISIYIR